MAQTIQAAPASTKKVRALSPAPAPAGPLANAPTRVAARMCPTRTDGAEPLFQHRLSVSQCSAKQGTGYHKCFTCAHGCDAG